MFPTDAAFDLYATGPEITLLPNDICLVGTGIAIYLPKDYFAVIVGRSSFNRNGFIVHQGIIDPGYKNELKIVIHNLSKRNSLTVKTGMRLAQLIIHPCISSLVKFSFFPTLENDPSLTEEKCREGGFGSTGVF
jgi:dUTP pyrophosphatase